MHRLLYTDEARKQISKLGERLTIQIKTALEEIAKSPFNGKPLTRELKGLFAYRVSDYRIVYRIYRAEVVVLVLTVGHRRDVYEKLSRKKG